MSAPKSRNSRISASGEMPAAIVGMGDQREIAIFRAQACTVDRPASIGATITMARPASRARASWSRIGI